MRDILIVGLGTIGTLYGWALSEAGVNVTHLVRKGRKQRYSSGILLDVYDLRPNHQKEQLTLYHPKCVEEDELEDRFDLVIIPTKHTQLLGAIEQLKTKVSRAIFLPFCAYWGEWETLDQLLPKGKYLLGYAGSTAGYRGDAMMLNVKTTYRIGSSGKERSPHLQQVIDLFAQADFIPDIKSDMLKWLWAHHAIVAGLMGTFLFVGVEKFRDNPIVSEKLVPAVKEALEVVKRRGVSLEDDKEAQLFLQDNERKAFEQFRQNLMSGKAGERMLTSGHQVTAKDEMRQFYLDILGTGRELGVSMPVLESFEEKLKELPHV